MRYTEICYTFVLGCCWGTAIFCFVSWGRWSKENEQFNNAYGDECIYGNLTVYEDCTDTDTWDVECHGKRSKFYYIPKSQSCDKNSIYQYDEVDCRCASVPPAFPSRGYKQWQSCWINKCNAEITFNDPHISQKKAALYLPLGICTLVAPILLPLIAISIWYRSCICITIPYECLKAFVPLIILAAVTLSPFAMFIVGCVFFVKSNRLLKEAAKWKNSFVDDCVFANQTEFVECIGDGGCDGSKSQYFYSILEACSQNPQILVDDGICYCEDPPFYPINDERLCWINDCNTKQYTFSDPELNQSKGKWFQGLSIGLIASALFCCCLYYVCEKKVKIDCKQCVERLQLQKRKKTEEVFKMEITQSNYTTAKITTEMNTATDAETTDNKHEQHSVKEFVPMMMSEFVPHQITDNAEGEIEELPVYGEVTQGEVD